MASDFRRATRVFHKDFVDYKVNLNFDGIVFKGDLGNISENGLCAIMPEEFNAVQGAVVNGFLTYEPAKEKIDLAGRIAWRTNYEHHKEPRIMLGMEFSEPFYFPEHLMALSMSFE